MARRSLNVRENVILICAVLLTIGVIVPERCQAQSQDKKNPTPLLGREIVERAEYPIPKTGWGQTFYFTFLAGPGEVTVTVMSWSGEQTTHLWDGPDERTGGKDRTPGRPAGGWFEGRFIVPNSNGAGGTNLGSRRGVRHNVTFEEYTTNHTHGVPGITRKPARPFPAIGLIGPLEQGKREVSKTFTLPKQARLIMILNLSGRFDYRIKVDGPIIGVDPSQ
jgi:hypothetical protein